MKVRCTGKFTIAVGSTTYGETVNIMNKIYNEINELGIKCKLYIKRHLIVTNKIIIKFIFKKYYSHYNRNIYGIKCHGCYGFNDEEAYNITDGHNKCKGYGLIDYILKGET